MGENTYREDVSESAGGLFVVGGMQIQSGLLFYAVNQDIVLTKAFASAPDGMSTEFSAELLLTQLT